MLRHQDVISSVLLSPYSNGPLEGKNNLCKVIKRFAQIVINFYIL
ncbi:MAG: transposase [Bacilli bacterium]|nr:transposase [Bacilli bacterium]